jgi:hypothetical protein
MMGGAISVESQQGRGTTFTVDLPAVVDPAPAGTVLTLPQRPDSSATVPRAAIA